MTTLGEIEIREQTFKAAAEVCRPFSEAAGVHSRGYSLQTKGAETDRPGLRARATCSLHLPVRLSLLSGFKVAR